MTQPQRKIDVIVDGQPVSDSIIKKYDLNKEKDISYSKNQESYVSIFVGIVQRRESILVSLPKHFKHVEDFKNSNYETQKKDIRLIMDCISESTHDLQNDKYDLNKESSSDFPIEMYFNIYRYFARYGLYHEEYREVKPNNGSKILWKETIKNSMKFIVNGNLIFSPIFYQRVRDNETIITDCMVTIINYTTSILGDFFTLPDNSMLVNRGINLSIFDNESVIYRLEEILSKTFKDINQELIRNIITYIKFANSLKKETLSIKYYNFASTWETAVQKYLNDHFCGVDRNNNMIFTDKGSQKIFTKTPIYYNSVSKYSNWYIEPDHTLVDVSNKVIYLLDSKYYTKLTDINHKQFMYHILYKNKYPYFHVYDSLLLPYEGNNFSDEYVDIKDDFLLQCGNNLKENAITIYITKLNTVEVLKNYIS